MPALVVRTEDAALPKRIVLRRIWSVTGVTRKPSGAIEPFSTVRMFKTSTDLLARTAKTSDANGTYAFDVYDRDAYYVVSTKYAAYRADVDTITADTDRIFADVSEVAGATLNNIVGL